MILHVHLSKWRMHIKERSVINVWTCHSPKMCFIPATKKKLKKTITIMQVIKINTYIILNNADCDFILLLYWITIIKVKNVKVRILQFVIKIITQLREITCHKGSHSVTCHPEAMTFLPLPQPKLVRDLATPETCKAELTWVVVIFQDSLTAKYGQRSQK